MRWLTILLLMLAAPVAASPRDWIEALIAEALARAEPPLDPSAQQRLIIKSALAKQRPRRPRGA